MKIQGKKIPISSTKDVELSPFVVRISRDPIELLQKSLVIDGDTREGYVEAPLVEALRGEDLSVTFRDIEGQVADSSPGSPLTVPHASIEEGEIVHLPIGLEQSPILLDDIFEISEKDSVFVSRSKPRVQMSSLRATLAFAIFASLWIFPIQAYNVFAHSRNLATQGLTEATEGVDALIKGSEDLISGNAQNAKKHFVTAQQNFLDIQEQTAQIPAILGTLISVATGEKNTLASASSLSSALQSLSLAGSTFAEGLKYTQQSGAGIAQNIQTLGMFAKEASIDMEKAKTSLDRVDAEAFPSEAQKNIQQAKTYVKNAAEALNEYGRIAQVLGTVFGGSESRKYLVVFQNTAELRATGGFMGSLAEVTIENGKLQDIRVPDQGIYATQGQLTKFVAAPEPLQLLKARWELQDTNWFPEFPMSARKVLEFYEASGAPSFDGVIAVNSNVLPDIVALFEPISMPAYNKEISSENVLFEMQKAVEQEYDKEQNTPKAFVGDLLDELRLRLENVDQQKLLEMAQILATDLENKNIQVYFTRNEEQASASQLGFTGELRKTSGDYFFPVSTNIGGGKTDTIIDQQFVVDINIQADGTVMHNVSLKKTHTGIKDAAFTGVNNVDYFRLYVPQGSVPLSASGFEPPAEDLFEKADPNILSDIDLQFATQGKYRDTNTGLDVWNESGYTVFGGWIQTAPGEQQDVSLSYSTPLQLQEKHAETAVQKVKDFFTRQGERRVYTLTVDSQSGIDTRALEIAVHAPSNWQKIFATGEPSDIAESGGFVGYLFEITP
jgi:hypothetical protein